MPSLDAMPLMIAVASNFATTMDSLAEAYQQSGSNEIVISVGSSGKHFAQIRRGAPYQLFFSADSHYPNELIKLGFANNAITYAYGQVVIYSATSIPTDNLAVWISQTLLFNQQHENKTTIAIANPRLAPYGIAARELFTHLGLWSQIQPHLVIGNNINQTMLFAFAGKVQFAVLATSQFVHATKPTKAQKYITEKRDVSTNTTTSVSCFTRKMTNNQADYWCKVPQEMYAPITQQLIMLNDTPLARHFIAFVLGKTGRNIIASNGYRLPPSAGPH